MRTRLQRPSTTKDTRMLVREVLTCADQQRMAHCISVLKEVARSFGYELCIVTDDAEGSGERHGAIAYILVLVLAGSHIGKQPHSQS